MSLDELLKHVPPEVIYRRVPLPAEKNALGPWQEAARCLVVSEDDELWGKLFGDSACEREETCESDKDAEIEEPFTPPPDVDCQRIRRLLDENRAAVELSDEGIRRGALQLPEIHGSSQWRDFVDMPAIRKMVRLRILAAKALAAEDKSAEATEQLIRILRTGEILCGAECFVVDHLMGIAVQSAACTAISSFAALPAVPGDARARLLAAVEERLCHPDHVVECLRFDSWCCDLHDVDQFPDGADPGTLFDLWRAAEDPGETRHEALAELIAQAEARRPKRRQQFIFLLEGHPNPFDKIATVRLIAQKVADLLRALGEPLRMGVSDVEWRWGRLARSARRRWLRRQIARWPDQVFDPGYGTFGESEEEVRSRLAEWGMSSDKRVIAIFTPLTEEQLAVARKRLQQVNNPFGLLLASGAAEHRAFLVAVARCRGRLERLRRILHASLGGSTVG